MGLLGCIYYAWECVWQLPAQRSAWEAEDRQRLSILLREYCADDAEVLRIIAAQEGGDAAVMAKRSALDDPDDPEHRRTHQLVFCYGADGLSQCRSCTLKYNADQNSRGFREGGPLGFRGGSGGIRGRSAGRSDRDPRAIRGGFGRSA